jgi:hypothetical protein
MFNNPIFIIRDHLDQINNHCLFANFSARFFISTDLFHLEIFELERLIIALVFPYIYDYFPIINDLDPAQIMDQIS